jgi:hypothetical protein
MSDRNQIWVQNTSYLIPVHIIRYVVSLTYTVVKDIHVSRTGTMVKTLTVVVARVDMRH